MPFANSPHKEMYRITKGRAELSISVHASNTSTWEAKAGGQEGLKFKAILG